MARQSTTHEIVDMGNDFDYLVKLPLTRYDAHVRGLLVEDEVFIRSQTTTPKFMLESICRLIYKCTKFEMPVDDSGKLCENPFSTFEDFMRNIPDRDRDALLWGIIIKSYDEVHDISLTCDNCKAKFEKKVNIPQMMQIKSYTGKEPIMSKEVVLEMPEYDWKIHMKQPAINDELAILNYNAANTKLMSAAEYNMITKIETKMKITNDAGIESKEPVPYIAQNPIEIYDLISKKPAKVRKKIMKAWDENFGDFGVTVEFENICPSCRNVITTRLIPMGHLFSCLA